MKDDNKTHVTGFPEELTTPTTWSEADYQAEQDAAGIAYGAGLANAVPAPKAETVSSRLVDLRAAFEQVESMLCVAVGSLAARVLDPEPEELPHEVTAPLPSAREVGGSIGDHLDALCDLHTDITRQVGTIERLAGRL